MSNGFDGEWIGVSLSRDYYVKSQELAKKTKESGKTRKDATRHLEPSVSLRRSTFRDRMNKRSQSA